MTDKRIPVNLPFERVPVCACDMGGDPPTRLQMLECRAKGGPCRPSDKPDNFVEREQADG